MNKKGIQFLIPPPATYTANNGKTYRLIGRGGPRTKDWARGFNSCRASILKALRKHA